MPTGNFKAGLIPSLAILGVIFRGLGSPLFVFAKIQGKAIREIVAVFNVHVAKLIR